MKPGSDMSCAAASSLIGRLSCESSATTARRVRWGGAAKRVSRASSEYLTIRFSIGERWDFVNPCVSGVRDQPRTGSTKMRTATSNLGESPFLRFRELSLNLIEGVSDRNAKRAL